MKRAFAILVAWMILLGPVPATAAEWGGSLVINGAANVSLVDWYALGGQPAEASILELARLRAVGKAWYGEALTLEAAYELNAVLGKTRSGTGLELTSPTKLRLTDLNREFASGDDYALGQNLDRFNAVLSLSWLEATVGRQAISHGSGRLFNPTDIFAPVSPYTTYSEYKAGVDAVRLTKPVGEELELEFYAVAHEDGPAKGIYLGRLRRLFSGWDASLLAGFSLGEVTLAADLSGDIGGAGWYAEAIARLRDDVSTTLRATVGLQYHFGLGVDLVVEGHYNGPGRIEPESYGLAALTPEGRAGEIFLTGRWYGGFSLLYELHPLVESGLSGIVNAMDGSLLLLPSLDWEVASDVVLKAGASIGLGRRPEAVTDSSAPGGQVGIAKSEFGAYPNIYYLELQFTF